MANYKYFLRNGAVLLLVLCLLTSGCSSVNGRIFFHNYREYPPTIDNPDVTLLEYYSIRFDEWFNLDVFISYNILRDYFGDFHGFGVGTDGLGITPEGYRYYLVAESQQKFVLDIHEMSVPVNYYDWSDNDPCYAGITDIPNKNDLSTKLEVEEFDGYFSVYYYVGDIRYIYSAYDGHLRCVEWITQNHRFSLSVHEKPAENSSFVARLLCEDTAEEAVADFDAHISRCLAVRRFCRFHLPRVLTVVAFFAIAVLLIYLLCRAKRQKRLGLQ